MLHMHVRNTVISDHEWKNKREGTIFRFVDNQIELRDKVGIESHKMEKQSLRSPFWFINNVIIVTVI